MGVDDHFEDWVGGAGDQELARITVGLFLPHGEEGGGVIAIKYLVTRAT